MTTIPPSENPLARWYYADANHQRVGPVTTETLYFRLLIGTITFDTLVLPKGGSQWQPCYTVFTDAGAGSGIASKPPKESRGDVRHGAKHVLAFRIVAFSRAGRYAEIGWEVQGGASLCLGRIPLAFAGRGKLANRKVL